MSLQRQLLFAVTGLFMLLLLGNLVVSVINSRNYLQDQLQVHAQDTATSLGLSLSQAAKTGDKATLESLVNVIFDGGYYRRIRYLDLSGAVQLEREYPIVIDEVPAWFIDWVRLPEPFGKAEVVSGWYQLGTVEVVGHPGFAYRDLWKVFKEQLWLFFFIAVLAYVAASLSLRYLLKPLRQVEEQAEAICQRDFSTQLALPKTTELRRVVIALNRMVRKIADMFQEQLLLSESLFRQAHIDPVTGLSNRSDFDARMQSFLTSERRGESAALILLHIDSLHKLNNREGRLSGDLCLQAVSEVLRTQLADWPDVILSRRGGSDFCIFIPLADPADAQALATNIYSSIECLEWFQQSDGAVCYIGATFNGSVQEATKLLEQADTALRQVQYTGPSGVSWYPWQEESRVSRGSDAWRQLLLEKLAKRQLLFDLQPVYGRGQNELLHLEVLARLEIDGQRRSAATFMAMAERLNLTPAVDRLLLEMVGQQFAGKTGPQLCINLSVLSLRNIEFLQWLEVFLRADSEFSRRLIFELNERSVQVAESDVRQFINKVKALGCSVSLDHVGLNGAALHYLHSLGIVSLKVSQRFVQRLAEDKNNQFFIRSLVHIAHSCDALIFAEGVESEACWASALALGIDGGQGFYLGKPQPSWPEERE